jgi:hypothetical protein
MIGILMKLFIYDLLIYFFKIKTISGGDYMSTWRFFITVTLTLMLALVLGCSSGNAPVAPQNNAGVLDNVPVIGLTEVNGVFDAQGLLGAYEIIVNPENQTVDLVSKRSNAIGEAYIVSGAGFFTVAPCSTCLRMVGFFFDSSTLTLTLEIKHPFMPGNMSEPPSAANRKDLDVFDLAAVIDPTLDETIPASFTTIGADIYSSLCVDPSGYTTELSDVIADDAALPYFLVVDDSAVIPPASTFNKFAMGATNNFDVRFNLGSGPVQYDLYLTMGYGASAKKPGRLTPKYYNPEFNRNAAWKVKAVPPSPCVMGSTWQDNDATTPYNVQVEVYDWQTGATVWADPLTFADAPADNVWAASEVSEVQVEILGMTAAPGSATTPVSGTGMPGSPLVFNVPLANENLLVPGEYPGLVKVLDGRAPLTPTDGRDFLIHTPDGIALVNHTMTEYATYQTFTACVVSGCGPISGQIDSPTCPVTDIGTGTTIGFAVSASSANGGDPIALYEADWDYDGVTFTAEDSNATGIFAGHTFNVPDPCGDNIPYTWTVAFRATDSCSPANTSIFATCEVTANECCSYDELIYNFDSCTSLATTCGDWTAGGCGLSNTDGYNNWGNFHWGCNGYGTSCSGISGGMLTTGGDGLSCGYMGDTGPNCDYNVVSPSFTLPTAADSFLEWDACLSLTPSGGAFRVYISTNGCSGPWTQIGNYTTSGCQVNQMISLTSYSSSTAMFRFQYASTSGYTSGSCGQAGVVLDNVRVGGTWCGVFQEN